VSDELAARDRLVALARRAAAARGAEPPALATLRAEALARFADAGLPTTRQEEWRYTSLAPLLGLAFEAPAPGAAAPRDEIEEIAAPFFACSAFVFVDGRLVPELSSPAALAGGVRVEGLAAAADSAGSLGVLADTKQHPFAALNSALFEDAALVTVPRGTSAQQPIHLVFVSTGDGAPRATFPRVLIRARAGSRALVIQDHVSLGRGARLSAAVSEALVEENASLELVVLQRESDETFHFGNLQARLARDARFASRTLTLGGALVRNDLGALLAGPGAECQLDGLFLGSDGHLVDNHTLVDHAEPHCTSRELYKGILADRSRGVFRGRIVVRPDAQKTDAQQSNANVLLGAGAEIDTKPQLEIWADDVRCSHGASIGRLDEDALFYLRSRGIGESAARDLLTRGFAAEVLRRIGSEPLAEALGDLLLARLRGEA
jgi:Fe-S cluster assembly protein SufD